VAVVLGFLLCGDRLAPLDPARSRAELETLLAAAPPDGFIGHTIFWEHPVSGARSLFYNVIHRKSGADGRRVAGVR
jgi:hypothetical protein